MTQQYDNTDTFVLFLNDKGDNERAPDRTGTLNVGGVEYFMDGWIKQGKKGPFLSGRIKPKRPKVETYEGGFRRNAPRDEPEPDVPF